MLVEVSPIGVNNAELERLLGTFVMHGVRVVHGVVCVGCGALCVWGMWCVVCVCGVCSMSVFCVAIVSYKCLLVYSAIMHVSRTNVSVGFINYCTCV